MKKVLLLQSQIREYRIPTFKHVVEKYELTVATYGDEKKTEDFGLNVIKLKTIGIGPFQFIKGLRHLAREYDVVVMQPDLHIPSCFLLPFLPHRYKVVSWSIGFRCSYEHPYITTRKHVLADNLFERVLEKCDANIFYMDKAKEFWKDSTLNMDKVFVAPNTTGVEANCNDNRSLKKDVLFIGTLYKGKGIDLLIKSFAEACRTQHSDSKLYIIGKGPMREELEVIAQSNNISDQVVFVGPVYDEQIISTYFQKAVLCISPTQGGLTCPKSMGYGVPFVCRKDAITGGEIYHMTTGVNGIMYEQDSELTGIIVDAMKNPDKFIEMGTLAKSYYDNNATPKHMAEGIIDAIEYVSNKN